MKNQTKQQQKKKLGWKSYIKRKRCDYSEKFKAFGYV